MDIVYFETLLQRGPRGTLPGLSNWSPKRWPVWKAGKSNPTIDGLILAILSWPRSDLRIVNIPKERIASCRGFKGEGGEAFTKYLVRGLPLPKIVSAKYFSRCCQLERLLTFFRNRIFQKLFDTDSPSEDFMNFLVWFILVQFPKTRKRFIDQHANVAIEEHGKENARNVFCYVWFVT